MRYTITPLATNTQGESVKVLPEVAEYFGVYLKIDGQYHWVQDFKTEAEARQFLEERS